MSNPILDVRVERTRSDTRPLHHVEATDSLSGWTSYLASWTPSPGRARPRKGAGGGGEDITGYRNPWPSWHTPTRKEVWDAMQWGPDTDPCINLAASHLSDADASAEPAAEEQPSFASAADPTSSSIATQAARLLRLRKPDFSFDPTAERAKTTWLGHASILLQLPPLRDGGEPIRCLFDPIFSMRCSPTQSAGPIRSYPPPCAVQDLPPVDVYLISHNHYDHLDYDTVMAVWQRNEDRMRFVVPVGNKRWFVECGIPADRVTELDWWDSAHLASPFSDSKTLGIWCTPAQHSSGRAVSDANSALWSSWYIQHPGTPASRRPYRIFFAGDTGYQFHGSSCWPPSPPAQPQPQRQPSPSSRHTSQPMSFGTPAETFPPCPAFAEIRSRLGPPHLLLLPVAVGATYAYFRSFAYLPDSVSPFPRHSPGLTAAIHMPPWDAVRVMRVLSGTGDVGNERDTGASPSLEQDKREEEEAVAISMHWGTFVTDPVEVLKTLGQLEWACQQHEVRFGRALPEGERKEMCFLALDHGQSVSL